MTEMHELEMRRPLNDQEQHTLIHNKDIDSLHKVWNKTKVGNKFPVDPSKTKRPVRRGSGVTETDGPLAEDEIDAKGVVSAKELEAELKSMHREELVNQLGISWTKIKEIVRRSSDEDGNVTYRKFLEVVSRYRLNTEQATTLKSIVKAFAYVEEFSCTPFKWFIPLVTLLETCIYVYHVVHLSSEHNLNITWDGPVPYCSVFIYNPYRRYEVWRYLTYMLVHIGLLHYIFNMIMQILVGVFLEMEQEGWIGSFKVAAVYISGVLAGSLGTSIVDPNTYVAGASGGIYALISAHLATMILNWKEDNAVKIQKTIHKPLVKIVRILFIGFLTVHDFSVAIYETVILRQESRTGYVGHLCGALAGVLVGLFVLDNRRIQPWEGAVKIISILVFALLILFAIIWNISGNYIVDAYFPAAKYDTSHCDIYLYL